MRTETPTAAGLSDVDARATALALVCSAALFSFTFLDPLLLAYFRGADPALIGFWRAATGVGDSGWMIVSCVVAAVAAHRVARRDGRAPRRAALALRRRAVFALASVAGVGGAAALAKLAIGRARPKLSETLGPYHFEPLAFDFKLNSLPSGHATALFAFAAALALMAPRWRPAFYAVALWGALSRTAAGAHYVSDVIVGAAVGYYGARALSRVAAARGWPVALADAPAEGRAAQRAARLILRGMARRAATAAHGALGALRRAAKTRLRADA